MSVKTQVKQFVLTHYLFTDDPAKLADDASFMKSGTMDSTGILELIMFLEESFGISVADAEMVPDNLDSIDRVCEFVQRKQAAR